MLDTNVLIRLRDGDPVITEAVSKLNGGLIMSVVTRVELEGGAYRFPAEAVARRRRLDAIFAAIPTLAFDETAALAYAAIVAETGYSRRKLLDRMIAAQAIVHKARLITTNASDFEDISGLDLVSW